MRMEELNFELPVELIAKRPREERGELREDSRMLVMDRATGSIVHRKFSQLIEYLNPGDTLILNNSKVIPSRLMGQRENGGTVEIYLFSRRGQDVWQAILMPERFITPGMNLSFPGSEVTARVVEKAQPGWIIEFTCQQNFIEWLSEYGVFATSMYADMQDSSSFQTVYAVKPGSTELPSAGRHFTVELLDRIRQKGVNIVYITLHVGLSSINVEEELVENHQMMEEWFEISAQDAEIINACKSAGHKVMAIGTTVVRTVESNVQDGKLVPNTGWTNLYIYPGFEFKIIDNFVTNFHQPQSTRILMAAAFTGKDLLMRGYREAINERYLFYEFGDTTLTI